MKHIGTTLLLFTLSVTLFAQSKSYKTLRDRFADADNVFSFQTSGFFARGILWMAGEHEFKNAIKEVRGIRLMVIPKQAFRQEKVSMKGFLKIAHEDSFEEVARVADNDEEVTLLIQDKDVKNKHHRYLLLVDNDREVVAMEIRGHIDPAVLNGERITYLK